MYVGKGNKRVRRREGEREREREKGGEMEGGR